MSSVTDFSHWETDRLKQWDALVIGGGITGLSTALSLRERLPNARISVLERGSFPSGASTRNAGFACFGSLTELLADIGSLGEEGVLRLVDDRWRGLQRLRQRLGDSAMDYELSGGYELILPGRADALDELSRVNKLLAQIFHSDVFLLQNERIDAFGFPGQKVRALVHNRFEGFLHPVKLMGALERLCAERDIVHLRGTPVTSLHEAGPCAVVGLANGFTMHAERVAVCTNAFVPDLLPGADLKPGRGQVLITEPLGGLKFSGAFHIDAGYYYFRNVGDRVLLGGGRNLDQTTETTTEFGPNYRILEDLQDKLFTLILPGQRFKIAANWSGIMAFGADKSPLVARHSERIAVGARLGGMGVALGSRVGDQVADLLTQ